MVPELTVSDFDRSLAFYARGVGFRVAFTRPNPPFAYLDLEGAQLMISEFQEDGWNVGELARPYGRGVNLQIECSDVGGLRDDLARRSYPPLPRDRRSVVPDGGRGVGPAGVSGPGP